MSNSGWVRAEDISEFEDTLIETTQNAITKQKRLKKKDWWPEGQL